PDLVRGASVRRSRRRRGGRSGSETRLDQGPGGRAVPRENRRRGGATIRRHRGRIQTGAPPRGEGPGPGGGPSVRMALRGEVAGIPRGHRRPAPRVRRSVSDGQREPHPRRAVPEPRVRREARGPDRRDPRRRRAWPVPEDGQYRPGRDGERGPSTVPPLEKPSRGGGPLTLGKGISGRRSSRRPVKPYHVETLKAIALLGGLKEYVNLSSGELGKLIGVSQQSASQRILEMIRDGLVARDLATRRQRIRLTP